MKDATISTPTALKPENADMLCYMKEWGDSGVVAS